MSTQLLQKSLDGLSNGVREQNEKALYLESTLKTVTQKKKTNLISNYQRSRLEPEIKQMLKDGMNETDVNSSMLHRTNN